MGEPVSEAFKLVVLEVGSNYLVLYLLILWDEVEVLRCFLLFLFDARRCLS